MRPPLPRYASLLLLGSLTAASFGFFVSGCATSATSATSVPAANAPVATAPSQPTAAATPVGKTWALSMLYDKPIKTENERARPTLRLDAEQNRASGRGGVNGYGGNYMLTGSALKFGPLMATKMAGSPLQNELETRYLRMLASVTAWRIEGGELELLVEGAPVARYTAQP